MRIVVVLPAPFGPMKPEHLAALDAERHVVHGVHAVEVADEPVELQHRAAHRSPRAGLGPSEHEMKAAALVDARDAGLPERRAFEHGEIRAGRLMLEEVRESRRLRRIGRHGSAGDRDAPVVRIAWPPGGSGPARRYGVAPSR